MARCHQIYEDDLCALEATLPRLMDDHDENWTATDRTRWRQVQQVLLRVRWNYGPHENVERVEPTSESSE